jgi:Sulfite exporter TauE/SafE
MTTLMGTVTLLQYVLVAVTAFCASIIGGVAGYGTGLLMPLVLVPIIGAEAVVPVIGLSAMFTNSSRLAAFWSVFDAKKALIVGLAAIPTCMLGSYGYTRLTGPNAAIWIGAVLIALVPLRRCAAVDPDGGGPRRCSRHRHGCGRVTDCWRGQNRHVPHPWRVAVVVGGDGGVNRHLRHPWRFHCQTANPVVIVDTAHQHP